MGTMETREEGTTSWSNITSVVVVIVVFLEFLLLSPISRPTVDIFFHFFVLLLYKPLPLRKNRQFRSNTAKFNRSQLSRELDGKNGKKMHDGIRETNQEKQ